MIEQEKWHDIPGFPGYKVSNLGHVGSCYQRVKGHGKRGWFLSKEIQRVLSPSSTKAGYLGVGLRVNGKSFYKRVHFLVMLAFVGSCPDGLEVCHNNGNSGDNRLSNLRYDTRLSNMLEARVNSEKYLSEEQVINIRQDCSFGMHIFDVARKYNISYDRVRRVRSGLSYAYYGGPIIRGNHLRYSVGDVVEIRARVACGDSRGTVARLFDTKAANISHMVRGDSRHDAPTITRHDVSSDYYYLTISY